MSQEQATTIANRIGREFVGIKLSQPVAVLDEGFVDTPFFKSKFLLMTVPSRFVSVVEMPSSTFTDEWQLHNNNRLKDGKDFDYVVDDTTRNDFNSELKSKLTALTRFLTVDIAPSYLLLNTAIENTIDGVKELVPSIEVEKSSYAVFERVMRDSLLIQFIDWSSNACKLDDVSRQTLIHKYVGGTESRQSKNPSIADLLKQYEVEKVVEPVFGSFQT